MGGSSRRFTHESLQDAKSIRTLLSELSKGFAKGEMTLSDDEGELVLNTGGLMNVRVKAEREAGRCQFSLRVSWSDPEEAPRAKGAPRIES